MSSAQLYDTIGATYTVTRRTEPRIAAQVWAALGGARTVVNVGAGTGCTACHRRIRELLRERNPAREHAPHCGLMPAHSH